MNDGILHKMVAEALQAHCIGKKISDVEYIAPDCMKATLETGLTVTMRVVEITPPIDLTKEG